MPTGSSKLKIRCARHRYIAVVMSMPALRWRRPVSTLIRKPPYPPNLKLSSGKAGQKAVPALFWSSTCLSNWINMNRDRPTGIAELSTAATMMQRVLELDETFYYGGAHMFFGVYYGGRSPMFGGNYALSEQHFERAAEINDNKLLLVDLLYAEYLSRQKLDRVSFHDRLTRVVDAPVDLYPEMALVNEIARVRAERLLEHESDWF